MNWLRFITPKYWPFRTPDGSTLQQLPPERLRADYDDWAVKTWTAWREGRGTYNANLGDNQFEEVCPSCYHASISSNAQYMVANHPDAAARRRWARSAEIDQLKFETLGDCQCGQRQQPGHLDLSQLEQYFPPRQEKT